MANDGVPVERLRTYLRELSPEARALLVSELERGLLRGDDMPGASLILQELRGQMAPADRQPERVGNPARLFFQPLEPFLVDDRVDRKHRGRISRASLDAIWEWICRDLLPTYIVPYSDQVGGLLLAGDQKGALQAAKDLQDKAIAAIEGVLAAVRGNEKAQRRLARQVGTPDALTNLTDILTVLKAREALAAIGSRLPVQIANLSDDQLDHVKALLDAIHTRQRDLFLHAVLLVMSRLVTPWQLIRLAIKEAASDEAARIAETPYAVAVTLVLTDMERLVSKLRIELKSGNTAVVTGLLKELHGGVRALRTEMNLSGDSPWARQLAAQRGEMASLLEAEIEAAPSRVRRLLRPRATKEIAPDSQLDSIDVDDVEAVVAIVAACRTYASELAINEVTLRVFSELQSYLDSHTAGLLEALRSAVASDRTFRLSQVEAAIRFAGKIFGQEYAALLSKAADVARQGERKAAGKA